MTIGALPTAIAAPEKRTPETFARSSTYTLVAPGSAKAKTVRLAEVVLPVQKTTIGAAYRHKKHASQTFAAATKPKTPDSQGITDPSANTINMAKPSHAAKLQLNSQIKLTSATAQPAELQPVAPVAEVKKEQKPIKIEPSLVVRVNLKTQTMRVSVHGAEKYVWRVSSGRGRYRTPNGTWKPTWLSRMHRSRQYGNAPMPYTVFFYNGYAVHGTNHTRALGRPASHGCIRLHTSNARKFYNLVRKHGKVATRISIVGKTPYTPRRRVASWKKRKAQKRRGFSSNRGRRGRTVRRKKKTFWPFDM